jgi:hypothetical protein
MAVIEDGTYYIVPKADTSKALDVTGASKYNGANVEIWHQNTTAAQIAHVMTLSTGARYIRFPLTGCLLDYGSPSGNVFQYAESGSNGQKWKIDDANSTFTANGKRCEAFIIRAFYTSNIVLSCYAQGTTTINGNAQWNTMSGTPNDGQLWAFVTMPTVIDGTYIMKSSYDLDLCTDITWASQANWANVQVCSLNGGNNQIVSIKDNGDGTVAIFDVNSGKVYRTTTENPSPGENINIFTHDASPTQKWILQQHGVKVMGAETWPTVEVKNAAGNTMCMDVAGRSMVPGANVQLWPDNDTAAQRFILDPTEAYGPTMPVPSGLMLRYPDGRDRASPWGNCISYDGISDGVKNTDGSWTTKFYPSLVCTTPILQMRYRLITYSAKNHAKTSTSSWMSIRDGSIANSGWGTIWTSNVTMTKSGTRLVSPYPISVTVGSKSGQNDLVDVEIQSRSFTEHWGEEDAIVHGPTYDAKCSVHWSATPIFDKIVRTFSELWIPFTSDLPSICTTAKATIQGHKADGSLLFADYSATGLSASDTIKVPLSSLQEDITDGEKITLKCTLTTANAIARVTIQKNVIVDSDSDHGIIVTPRWKYDPSRRAYLVTFKSGTENACWLYIDRGHCKSWARMPQISSTTDTVTFLALPQLNRSAEMICEAYTSDSKWGFNRDTLAPIVSNDAVWNWGSMATETDWSGYSALTVDKDDAPSHTYELTPDFTKHTTTGREHEVVSFGQSVAGEFKASGLIVKNLESKIPGQNEDNFDTLAYQGSLGNDVIYRDSMNRWAYVAVTAISQPHQTEGYSTLNVSMVEVTP